MRKLKAHRPDAQRFGRLALAASCLFLGWTLGAPSYGGQQGRAEAGQSLALPTGDRSTSHLLVEVISPEQVRVGQDYDYRIRLTNLSRDLVLEDVKVHQSRVDGYAIEKSEPGLDKSSQGGDASWSLPKLEPGATKEIKVTGMAESVEAMAGCLRVDYRPALCLKTKFIKPEIQVTKSAPKQADICRPLELRYRITNTGNGPARNLTLKDELPKGLTTVDGGKRNVAFEVGELGAGQSREFSTRVVAAEAGEYTSRAAAEGAGDLSARSNRTTTQIIQAQLAINIEGPESQYFERPATYRVRVKNTGNAPAMEARLRVEADADAKVVRMSKTDPGDAAPERSGQSMNWDLGTLEPGGERVVSFTTTTQSQSDLQHKATVTSACDRGGDFAKATAKTDTIKTAVLTLPALRLEMIDQIDPIRVGDEEVYTIAVRNQGSGEDKDVRVTCELPEQFKFVSAYGATKAKTDGRKITLGPIDRLGPNEKVSWTIRVKAEKAGDVRNKVELSSEYLDRAVPEFEPTRILGSGSGGSSDSSE